MWSQGMASEGCSLLLTATPLPFPLQSLEMRVYKCHLTPLWRLAGEVDGKGAQRFCDGWIGRAGSMFKPGDKARSEEG